MAVTASKVIYQQAKRCHHRNSAILDFIATHFQELGLIALLADLQGIKVAQWSNGTSLSCRAEYRSWWLSRSW